MKYTDINKVFTEKVTEYMVKGYILNSSTMRGSQGERAHVDLTNGSEIIRIVVADFTEEIIFHGIEVIVGRSTDNIVPNTEDIWNVLWTSRLEVLSRNAFYEIGEGRNGKFFGTKEEASAARNVRRARCCANYTSGSSDITSKAMRGIAKNIVRNRMGVRRPDEAAVKLSRSDRGYTVSYKGKSVSIH